MSQADESIQTAPGMVADHLDETEDHLDWADLRSAVQWLRSHPVLTAAVMLIAAQLAWKAQFLSHQYFRQDDFHDLDLAIEHPFNWSYLTFIGSGHLIIGLRVIDWLLVRTSPYNYGLASAVDLAFVAAAAFAAYRALRTLFGERPAILIPLALYVLSPLTIPDLAWWSAAMESVPLQLAIFMAVTAHVHYVRTGRARHLVAALLWVAFGLAFFEKAMVLPPVLLVLTAGFLVDRRTLLGGAVHALVRFWRAWLIYGAMLIGYAILLAFALRTSASLPTVPASSGGALQFVGELVKDTFLPGAFGGPWRWYPLVGGSYALALPTAFMTWVSVAAALGVIGISIARRTVAIRAWVILAGWILLADALPVILGRINAIAPIILGLETRYVADAVPVLALCIGLAFWPVTDAPRAQPARRHPLSATAVQYMGNAIAAVLGLVIVGSIWSAQSYESVTTGSQARTYIANAAAALKLVPRGVNVLDQPVPGSIVVGLFERYSLASTVIGDMARGKLAGKVHWIKYPEGTINGLYVPGADGRLYPAWVYPGASVPRTKAQGCWPERHGRVTVTLQGPSSIYTGILRLGYILYSHHPTVVIVKYGNVLSTLEVRPGLNSAFVTESGGYVTQVTVEGLGSTRICVGDVEVGNIEPSTTGTPIPLVSH